MDRNPKKLFATGFLLAAGACFIFGTAVTVSDVILRATSGANVPAAIELTSLSIGLGALLSMPIGYAYRAHVTAKLLSELSPMRFSRPLGIVSTVASVLFATLLAWIMGRHALEKFGGPQTTPDLGLPMDIALAVVAVTLLLALAAAVYAMVSTLRGRGEA
jgi:TRAP-type C4-dicarboxylate transport system permease small subunit